MRCQRNINLHCHQRVSCHLSLYYELHSNASNSYYCRPSTIIKRSMHAAEIYLYTAGGLTFMSCLPTLHSLLQNSHPRGPMKGPGGGSGSSWYVIRLSMPAISPSCTAGPWAPGKRGRCVESACKVRAKSIHLPASGFAEAVSSLISMLGEPVTAKARS
jgi:hypothetical protein